MKTKLEESSERCICDAPLGLQYNANVITELRVTTMKPHSGEHSLADGRKLKKYWVMSFNSMIGWFVEVWKKNVQWLQWTRNLTGLAKNPTILIPEHYDNETMPSFMHNTKLQVWRSYIFTTSSSTGARNLNFFHFNLWWIPACYDTWIHRHCN